MQLGYGYDQNARPSELYDRFGNRNYEYEAYNGQQNRYDMNGYGQYLNRRNYYRNYLGYSYPGYGYGYYNPYGRYGRQYNMGYGYGGNRMGAYGMGSYGMGGYGMGGYGLGGYGMGGYGMGGYGMQPYNSGI